MDAELYSGRGTFEWLLNTQGKMSRKQLDYRVYSSEEMHTLKSIL